MVCMRSRMKTVVVERQQQQKELKGVKTEPNKW